MNVAIFADWKLLRNHFQDLSHGVNLHDYSLIVIFTLFMYGGIFREEGNTTKKCENYPQRETFQVNCFIIFFSSSALFYAKTSKIYYF